MCRDLRDSKELKAKQHASYMMNDYRSQAFNKKNIVDGNGERPEGACFHGVFITLPLLHLLLLPSPTGLHFSSYLSVKPLLLYILKQK